MTTVKPQKAKAVAAPKPVTLPSLKSEIIEVSTPGGGREKEEEERGGETQMKTGWRISKGEDKPLDIMNDEGTLRRRQTPAFLRLSLSFFLKFIPSFFLRFSSNHVFCPSRPHPPKTTALHCQLPFLITLPLLSRGRPRDTMERRHR